jgi:O-antigen ligase
MDISFKKDHLILLMVFLLASSCLLFILSFLWSPITSFLIVTIIAVIAVLKLLKATISPTLSLPIELSQQPVKYKTTRVLFYLGTLTLPFLTFRIGGLTYSDTLYFISTLFLIFVFTKQRQITFYKINKVFFTGVILFTIGAVLSSINSYAPQESLIKIARVLYILIVWFTLSIFVLKNEKLVYKASVFWLIGVGISGFIAILQLKFDIPYTINHYGRMSAFTEHVSDLGAITSIALVPALVLGTTTRGLKAMFYYLLVLLIGLGVILSGSVSGFITVTLGFFIWVMIGKPNIKLILTIILLGGSVVGLFGYQESKGYVTPLSRIQSTTSYGENGTALHRLQTYELAWKEIKANPFIGKGYDEISNKTSNGFPVHNLFLAALYEGGLLALTGMIFIIVGIFYAGINSIKKAPSKKHYNLSLALFIAFVCALIFGMTAPFLYQRYLWITAALLLPLYIVAVNNKTHSDQTVQQLGTIK